MQETANVTKGDGFCHKALSAASLTLRSRKASSLSNFRGLRSGFGLVQVGYSMEMCVNWMTL